MPGTQPDDLDALGRRATAEERALGLLTLVSQWRLGMATRANYAAGACLVASMAWWLLADGPHARWAFCGTWLALGTSLWLTKRAMRRSEEAFDAFQAARSRTMALREHASTQGIDAGGWDTAARR